jgi:adenylate cyclase
MAERLYEARLERVFRASRFTVWGLVSDTNRWDRASGLTPGKYSWAERDGVRVRVGTARELGFDIEWVEPPYEWIEGRFVHGERRFSKGPVARGGFTARLKDGDAGATIVEAIAYVAGAGPFMPLIGPVMKRKFRGALSTYFDGLASVLAGTPRPDGAPMSNPDSAALDARDLIARQPYDALTQGPRSPVSDDELERRTARLRQTLRSPLVDRLKRALADRPDEEVSQMRPFELADRWAVDRRELLKVFLHATRAGLVDLKWQINCPVCRVAAQVVGSLSDVSGNVHCGACNIGYGGTSGNTWKPCFSATERSVTCKAKSFAHRARRSCRTSSRSSRSSRESPARSPRS